MAICSSDAAIILTALELVSEHLAVAPVQQETADEQSSAFEPGLIYTKIVQRVIMRFQIYHGKPCQQVTKFGSNAP